MLLLLLLLSINKSSTKPATICNPDGSLQITDRRENGPIALSGCLVASARPACASILASSRHHSNQVELDHCDFVLGRLAPQIGHKKLETLKEVARKTTGLKISLSPLTMAAAVLFQLHIASHLRACPCRLAE